MYSRLKATARPSDDIPQQAEDSPNAKQHRTTIPRWYLFPLKRLKDLRKLASYRDAQGIDKGEPARWLACASHAVFRLQGLRSDRTGEPHPGLTEATLAGFAAQIGLPGFPPDRLREIVETTTACEIEGKFKMTSTLAGRWLRLSREERTALDIRSMEAFTETTTARRARKRREKRDADRKRAEVKRRADGIEQRRQSQPWKAAGMSRATWFRHLKKERDAACNETATGPKSETRTSRTCPYPQYIDDDRFRVSHLPEGDSRTAAPATSPTAATPAGQPHTRRSDPDPAPAGPAPATAGPKRRAIRFVSRHPNIGGLQAAILDLQHELERRRGITPSATTTAVDGRESGIVAAFLGKGRTGR